MMINIRRSRHEEGEKLIAIWRRSVDTTHDFLSNAYRAELEELVSGFSARSATMGCRDRSG